MIFVMKRKYLIWYDWEKLSEIILNFKILQFVYLKELSVSNECKDLETVKQGEFLERYFNSGSERIKVI